MAEEPLEEEEEEEEVVVPPARIKALRIITILLITLNITIPILLFLPIPAAAKWAWLDLAREFHRLIGRTNSAAAAVAAIMTIGEEMEAALVADTREEPPEVRI